MGLKSCLPSRRHPAECREDCSCPPCCWESSTGERRRMFTHGQQRKLTPSVSQRSRLTFGNPSISPEPTIRNDTRIDQNFSSTSSCSSERVEKVTNDLHAAFTDCLPFVFHLNEGENKHFQEKPPEVRILLFFLHIVPKKGTESVATHLLERL